MDIYANVYDMYAYQSATIQAGDTLLAVAADNLGVRLDADMSVLGAHGLTAALAALLHLTARLPVYTCTDARDADHQRLARAMHRLGAIATDIDGRFSMWTLGGTH